MILLSIEYSAFILVPLLVGASYFTAYQAASNKCRAEAEKAPSNAIEEAKKNGAQDKKLARESHQRLQRKQKDDSMTLLKTLNKPSRLLPNLSCVITDDELLCL